MSTWSENRLPCHVAPSVIELEGDGGAATSIADGPQTTDRQWEVSVPLNGCQFLTSVSGLCACIHERLGEP